MTMLQDIETLSRIRAAVNGYRSSPYRSADSLANELMTIFDTEEADDPGVDREIDPKSERKAVVDWLRRGGETDAQGWFAWDSEMRSYAASFADRIEAKAHLKPGPAE